MGKKDIKNVFDLEDDGMGEEVEVKEETEIDEGEELSGEEEIEEEIDKSEEKQKIDTVISKDKVEPIKKPDLLDGVEKENLDSQYKSNYTYKVRGKQYQIDDFFKPLIKDKESEAKIIDILTQNTGLKEVQQMRDAERQNRQKIETEYNEFRSKFAPAQELYNQGKKVESILSLFSADDVMHVAEELKRYQEMDDRQKRIYENNLANNYDNYKHSKTIDSSSQEMRRLMEKNVELEINQAINFNDRTSDIADWYDSIYGEGEFKKEVYKYGRAEYNETNPITPTECVEFITKKLEKLRSRGNVSQQPQENSNNPNLSRKDRIPTARSSGSVVKKITKPKDFKEAIKMAQEEEESE